MKVRFELEIEQHEWVTVFERVLKAITDKPETLTPIINAFLNLEKK